MAPKSKIARLDPVIRERIAELHRQGRTLDEIIAKLRELEIADVSRSGVHRHVKGLEKWCERVRRSRDVADALVKGLDDAPESKTARAGIELVHAAILDLFGVEEDPEARPNFDPEALMMLSATLRNLTSAEKTDVERTLKIRHELARKAAAAAETVARRHGLSADVSQAIVDCILGTAK